MKKMNKRCNREEVVEGVDEEKGTRMSNVILMNMVTLLMMRKTMLMVLLKKERKFSVYDPTTNVLHIELAMLFENS